MDDRTHLVWWHARPRYLRNPQYMKGGNMDPDQENQELLELLRDDFIAEDLAIVLQQINDQIGQIAQQARDMGIEPKMLQTSSGDWPMRQLLGAKASVLLALVQIKAASNMAKSLRLNEPPV